MSLSNIDRDLLERCLSREPRAWEDFVDRFVGLVIHVANHVAETRGVNLSPDVRDDLVSEVFVLLLHDDFHVLRRFQRNASLATYLTVIARRVIVRRLLAEQMHANVAQRVASNGHPVRAEDSDSNAHEERLADAEEVQQMLDRLDPNEAEVVRLFHLEGRSYAEISQQTGVAENSIGPLLSRARKKMRG